MSMMTHEPHAAMVPIWEHPDDAETFWFQDRMHNPLPVSWLENDLFRTCQTNGMNRAHELYDAPIRFQGRRFWTYQYGAMTPLDLPPSELQAMGARSEQKFGQAVAMLEESWQTDWLPSIQRHLDHFANYDLSRASDTDLLLHFEDALERLEDLWYLHFKIVFPAYLAMSLFEELYCELFTDASAVRAYQLLQGLSNLTVESGTALWRLSRSVSESAALRNTFMTNPADAVVAALSTFSEGQNFLAEFDEFLATFGKRGELWGVTYPSWIEDPTPVINMIRDYINNPGSDPEHDQHLLAEEREQLIAEARMALATYPEAVRGKFEFLLKAAHTGATLSEDHGYWIDFQGMYEVRRLFLEIGRRLAATGVILKADDIFHLSVDEVRSSLTNPSGFDFRELVASRQAEIEQYRSFVPPPAVGTPPAGPPPDDPGARATDKFFGGPPPVSDDPDILLGAAGSAGVVRGPARIIYDIADAARLQPGDILVAATTAPPWTPLFKTVAAVVTDTGGVLSHCAVVAREYRIPAVVGTGFGTSAIPDGQMIEVDGERGIVRILRDA